MAVSLILLIAALVLFLLDALGAVIGSVRLQSLGLAALTGALIASP